MTSLLWIKFQRCVFHRISLDAEIYIHVTANRTANITKKYGIIIPYTAFP